VIPETRVSPQFWLCSHTPEDFALLTMWTFNPAVYLSHAWSKTNSGWGKTSLVLFYVYIWLGILKCTWGVFDPTFLGGATCYMTGASEFEENFMLGLIRGSCLFALAFLIYADKGGLHSWNVGFVTFVCLAWMWIAKATVLSKMDTTMYDECVGGRAGKISVWISMVWLLLAFVTVLVDERMADSATDGERLSLNV
jgi:hypothetical protein